MGTEADDGEPEETGLTLRGLALGLAAGLAIGAGFGLSTGDLPLWLGIGVVIGIGLAGAFSQALNG